MVTGQVCCCCHSGQSLRVSAAEERLLPAGRGRGGGAATAEAISAALRPSRSYPRWAEVASAVLEPNYQGTPSSRAVGNYRVIPASPRHRRSSYQRSNSVQHQPQLHQQQQQTQPQLHQVQLHHQAGVHRAQFRGSITSQDQQKRQQQFRSSVSITHTKFGICLACLFKKFVLR